jgi:hypothetical protein
VRRVPLGHAQFVGEPVCNAVADIVGPVLDGVGHVVEDVLGAVEEVVEQAVVVVVVAAVVVVSDVKGEDVVDEVVPQCGGV